jgi:hypothetical protein
VNLAITGVSLRLRVVAALVISAAVFAGSELTRRLIANRRPRADTERKSREFASDPLSRRTSLDSDTDGTTLTPRGSRFEACCLDLGRR